MTESSAGKKRSSGLMSAWLLALALACGLSATGCAKGTYLEVRFTGPSLLVIEAIRVELTLMPPGGAPAQQSIGTIRPKGGSNYPRRWRSSWMKREC